MPTAADALPPDRADAARRAVEANPVWYHTLELAPGVLTPGRVDLRGLAAKVLPTDLRGLRALDVGTFDGFWAFELERRGAEVVAIDVAAVADAEWPPLRRPRLEALLREWGLELGRGFELAAGALGSGVRRVVCDVRELDEAVTGGPVDLVFAGAVLVHLRDPVGALERVREVLAPGGELRVLEPVAVSESVLHPRRPLARFEAAHSDFEWWVPNVAALRAWLAAAGLVDVRRIGGRRTPRWPRGAPPSPPRPPRLPGRRARAAGGTRGPRVPICAVPAMGRPRG